MAQLKKTKFLGFWAEDTFAARAKKRAAQLRAPSLSEYIRRVTIADLDSQPLETTAPAADIIEQLARTYGAGYLPDFAVALAGHDQPRVLHNLLRDLLPALRGLSPQPDGSAAIVVEKRDRAEAAMHAAAAVTDYLNTLPDETARDAWRRAHLSDQHPSHPEQRPLKKRAAAG